MRRILALSTAVALLAGCSAAPEEVTPPTEGATVAPATPPEGETSPTPVNGETRDFTIDEHGTFTTGWAMTFLPVLLQTRVLSPFRGPSDRCVLRFSKRV